MMRTYLAALGLAVCLTAPAFAADDIAPERMALAKQVMELNGSAGAYENYDKNLDTMVNQLLAGVPNVDDKVVTDLKKIAVEEFNSYKPTLIEGATKVYARHFSEADLRALVAFYKSEAGQHFAAETPKLSSECIQLTAPFIKHLMERIKQYAAEKSATQNAGQTPEKSKSE